MKRRDLERRLRIAGCYLKREGSAHSLQMNPRTGVMDTPRGDSREGIIRRPGPMDGTRNLCGSCAF